MELIPGLDSVVCEIAEKNCILFEEAEIPRSEIYSRICKNRSIWKTDRRIHTGNLPICLV